MFCSSVTRKKFPEEFLAKVVLYALLSCLAAGSRASEYKAAVGLNIVAGQLADSLNRFSEQTGLQLIYEPAQVADKKTRALSGALGVPEALDRLLRGTGLRWRFVNDATVAIYRDRGPTPAASNRERKEPDAGRTAAHEIAQLSDVDVEDQRWLPTEGSTSAFGFSKPLLETPRTISYISEETIDIFGLSAVEDLLRVAPGVFTTTRFGIQGSVDVRNIPADTYFRGMKRLTLQGHGRSVLAAMDSIEVVGGPPSPLYGMGKIGGYTNVVPKSGRAKTGKYLSETQGFVQVIGGQYDRREASFGLGGPLSLLDGFGKSGGYYLYGLVENSNSSYAEGVPIKQQLLQAALSIDNFAGPFRLESGANFQVSRTAGALIGRFTQALTDEGAYISGSPLVNLDLNGNGSIGYLEMETASPVLGNLSANNQPLNQVWAWPTDAGGQYLSLGQFPQIAGIPASMYNYLLAHPEADPTGLLRAQGVGGPMPVSGAVPVGMVLDPRTVAYTTLNPRHSSAFERKLKAQFLTVYADLIYDADPNFTIKNQLFFDGMNQYKSSNQPFSQVQDVYVVEDKLTLTRRLEKLPSWLRVNALLAVNARNTVSEGSMSLADYANHRTDAMSAAWNTETAGMTANTTFVSANDNADIYADGFPWFSIYRTAFSEFGVGALLDVDLFSGTNVLAGGRIDGSQARNTDYAGRFNANTGNAGNPGAYLTTDDTAMAWDSGPSWSVSVSQQLPHSIRPYVTFARSSVMLDGNNNSLTNAVIRAGHIGSSELREAGVKATGLNGKLFFTGSAYKQGRVQISDSDDANVINAYATATTTYGWQAELKWGPTRNLLLSSYVLRQHTEYTPNVGGTIQVDARALGFKDVLDANGNVLYPAEAFLYGGRARLILPNNLQQYKKKQGNPDTQVGISSVLQIAMGVGLTFKANYLSSTCSGRLCLVVLPQSHVYDAGAFWEFRDWSLKLDVFNVLDEHYFRARTGDTLGDVIAQAMPGRHWQLTAKYKF